MNPSISVVVPVYNGEATLHELTESIIQTMAMTGTGFEIIFVDDGSPDGSWDEIRRMSPKDPHIRGIRLSRNFGQHNALIAGIRAARNDVIITMDDDLQHPPDQIPRLLEALTPEVDLVYGCANEEEHGRLRSLASRIVKLALAATLHSRVAKDISAFRAFRTYLRSAFDRNVDSEVNVDVLLSWSTRRVDAVSVRMDHRRVGKSNYTFRSLLRHALNMITGYSVLPLRLVTMLGLGFTCFGLMVLTYVLVRYLLYGGKVPGFTFIAALVALFSGAQMFALGILGEYLGRIHSRSMHEPQYVVRDATSLMAEYDSRPSIGIGRRESSTAEPSVAQISLDHRAGEDAVSHSDA
jgi:glycosyltransferase involved in cell wall biosynthesis